MSQTQTKTAIQSLPWYRYPMVWFVIMLPMSVVVASFITIAIAFENAPQLVPAKNVSSSMDTTNTQRKGS
ncbi:MAG: hypothetical protein AAF431_08175 [Pseudomonadota bacterium]